MTKSEFAGGMMKIEAAYKNKIARFNAEELGIWYQFLKDIDAGTFEKAIAEHIAGSAFPPTPADIIKRCEEISDKWRRYAYEVRDICLDAIHHYPSYEKCPDALIIMANIIMRYSRNIWMDIAAQMRNEIIAFVQEWEKSGQDQIIPIEKYFERYVT